MAGDVIREPATEPAAVLDDILRDVNGAPLIAEETAPAQAIVAESTEGGNARVVIDEAAYLPEAAALFDAELPDTSAHFAPAPPTPYLYYGQKMTRYYAELFEERYGAEIVATAEALAERMSPFAQEGSIQIGIFSTADNLMKWSGGPYHRGHTEEHFVAAAITYADQQGRQFTLPIYFVWETGKIEALFDAERVGR